MTAGGRLQHIALVRMRRVNTQRDEVRYDTKPARKHAMMLQRGCHKLALRLSILLLGARASTQAHAQVQASVSVPSLATATAPLVLRGVTVIDVRTGRRLPNRTVTVIGDRIRTVTPAGQARVPKGARVVPAQGKYLIPGLWDMHVHPERYADLVFPLWIANGVTGVRDAGSEVPLAQLVRWKREIAAGTRVGPRYLVSGPTLNAGDSNRQAIYIPDTASGWGMYVNVPPALGPYVVDSLQAGGADFLKMYGLTRAMYFNIAAEARRAGILFGGHAEEVSGLEASDSGATFLDHYTWFHPDVCGGPNSDSAAISAKACAAAAEQLRRNKTWVPILAGMLASPRVDLLRYMPVSMGLKRNQQAPPQAVPSSTAAWAPVWAEDLNEYRPVFARYLAAKLPILVGSDVAMSPKAMTRYLVPGFEVSELLLRFVLLGMTPLEALQTGTLSAAQALRASDSLGTVEAGKVADLVLLDADPLVDIWNTTKVWAVLANGRYYDRAALDELLTETEQAAARR